MASFKGEASHFPGLAAFTRSRCAPRYAGNVGHRLKIPIAPPPCTPRGDGDIAAREPMNMLLRGATLIDGTGADPLRSAAVRVEGDRIGPARDRGRAPRA